MIRPCEAEVRPGRLPSQDVAAFLPRSIETTVAVASLIALPWIARGEVAAAGGWIAGVVGSLVLVGVNRRLITAPVGASGNTQGPRLLVALLLKLFVAAGYLTFVFHGCNLSPIHFVAGFTLFLAVMAQKALLSAMRDETGSPITPGGRTAVYETDFPAGMPRS
jgi:hypothetical protein